MAARKKAEKLKAIIAGSRTKPAKRSHEKLSGDKHRRSTANLMPPWEPGQSGNPAGRPKRKTLEEVILTLLDKKPKKGSHETRLDELADVFLSEVIDNKKLIAMKELLDRLWPKLNRVSLGNDPDNPLTDPGPDLSKLSSAELRTWLKLRQKAAPDGGS